MLTETRNVVDYIVVCVNEFARRYGLSRQEASQYLRRHNGIQFLRDFYDVEHTLSFDEAVEDLTTVCRRNGGTLA